MKFKKIDLQAMAKNDPCDGFEIMRNLKFNILGWSKYELIFKYNKKFYKACSCSKSHEFPYEFDKDKDEVEVPEVFEYIESVVDYKEKSNGK